MILLLLLACVPPEPPAGTYERLAAAWGGTGSRLVACDHVAKAADCTVELPNGCLVTLWCEYDETASAVGRDEWGDEWACRREGRAECPGGTP